jgi:hypothetical protein
MNNEQIQQLKEKFFEDNVGKFSATNNDVVIPADEVWNWIEQNCLPIQEKSICKLHSNAVTIGTDGIIRCTYCGDEIKQESNATINKVTRLKPSEPDAIFLEQEKSDAIEFAEWIVDKYRKGECVGADGFNRDTIKYTAKELLEAFKSKTK